MIRRIENGMMGLVFAMGIISTVSGIQRFNDPRDYGIQIGTLSFVAVWLYNRK